VNPLSSHEMTVFAFLESLGISIDIEALPMYQQALTHGSYTYEYKRHTLDNYERMEFLGDAVLKIIVSHYLFRRFPYYREGELSQIRAVIVSDAVLARLAAQIHMGDYMIFGPNEARSGGARKTSNLACAFEAFLGALFLDDRMEVATNLVESLMEDEVTQVDMSDTKDNYKAVLQELTQADSLGLPTYITVREDGPSHKRTFTVEVSVNGEVLGRGQGASKKEAQQMAAKTALHCLDYLKTDTPPN
jgi:ribonuclease-3